MNVFDFDKTIVFPDSSFMFILYCFKHYPFAVLRSLFRLPLCKSVSEVKESLFSVLNRVDDIDSFVCKFWDLKFNHIQKWYLDIHHSDDVIISASPEFLVSEAARRLNVRYIATEMNIHTGKIIGLNCHDSEKVRRFIQEYPDEKIDAFYSDSISDKPLALMAEKAFIVNRKSIRNWPL